MRDRIPLFRTIRSKGSAQLDTCFTSVKIQTFRVAYVVAEDDAESPAASVHWGDRSLNHYRLDSGLINFTMQYAAGTPSAWVAVLLLLSSLQACLTQDVPFFGSSKDVIHVCTTDNPPRE